MFIGLHSLESVEAESNNIGNLIDHSIGEPNSSGHACICSRFTCASPCSYSVGFKPLIATHGVSTRMRRRFTARLMTHTPIYIYIYIYLSTYTFFLIYTYIQINNNRKVFKLISLFLYIYMYIFIYMCEYVIYMNENIIEHVSNPEICFFTRYYSELHGV